MTTSRGFTLIDLMIVVAIVAIAALLAMISFMAVEAFTSSGDIVCQDGDRVVFHASGVISGGAVRHSGGGIYIIPAGVSCVVER